MTTRRTADVRYEALLHLLATADTVWNASRLFFARWDLGPSQFNILNLLGGEPDGLAQIELGRRLIMHRSNVTGLVDRLEKRGLVARRDDAHDRRAYRVVLTAAGRRLLDEIYPQYRAAAAAAWDGVSSAAIQQTVTALHQVARNAEQIATARKGTA
jgi:MarR family 2-MHQ and catechol resistance regulon transcriptional repressor